MAAETEGASTKTVAHNVEIDENYDHEDDSGVESGDSSATTSLSSSVFSFTYANGRRYHSDRFKKADYFMPNDEKEQDRLDLYHHIFLLLKGGKLYTAPIEKPQRVLDVGTGTGIWAMEFAEENPQAEVIGTDISPIQPSWVPENLKFQVDDCEEEWTWADNYFDFIHMRSLSGSISDWPTLIGQCYAKMAEGGYFEFQDYCCDVYLNDGTLLAGPDTGHPAVTYIYHTTRAATALGRSLDIPQQMPQLLTDAGFVDIEVTKEIWPIGAWAKDPRLKELGKWGKLGSVESVYPFGLMLLTKQGWTEPQVRKLCNDVIDSYKRGGAKYYVQGWFVYGRKPAKEEKSKKKA